MGYDILSVIPPRHDETRPRLTAMYYHAGIRPFWCRQRF